MYVKTKATKATSLFETYGQYNEGAVQSQIQPLREILIKVFPVLVEASFKKKKKKILRIKYAYCDFFFKKTCNSMT